MGKMCDVAVGQRWCVSVLSALVLSVMGTSLGVAQVQDLRLEKCNSETRRSERTKIE